MDREKAEKPMTLNDWVLLRRAARAKVAASLFIEEEQNWSDLADKCDVRVEALEEGRVLP